MPSLVHSDTDTALRQHIFWQHAWELGGARYQPTAAQAQGGGEGQLESRLRRELLFCLLGGHGVGYELNRSAADRLWELGVLGPAPWTERQLRAELERPQFLPRRRDGQRRRYRYPARKAKLVADAWAWVGERRPPSELLLEIDDERDRRALLVTCPGLGPKSASWLLRNVGLAERLAILDIHVVAAMRQCGRIGSVRLPRDYAVAEAAYARWCDELGVDPAGFDLLVWDWSRQRPHG